MKTVSNPGLNKDSSLPADTQKQTNQSNSDSTSHHAHRAFHSSPAPRLAGFCFWFCVSQINPQRSEKAKEFSFWVRQKTQAFAPSFCWTNFKVWLVGDPNSSVGSRFIKESWLGRREITAPSYAENNSQQKLITCLLKAHYRTTDNL